MLQSLLVESSAAGPAEASRRASSPRAEVPERSQIVTVNSNDSITITVTRTIIATTIRITMSITISMTIIIITITIVSITITICCITNYSETCVSVIAVVANKIEAPMCLHMTHVSVIHSITHYILILHVIILSSSVIILTMAIIIIVRPLYILARADHRLGGMGVARHGR